MEIPIVTKPVSKSAFTFAIFKGKMLIDRVEGSDFYFYHFNDTKRITIPIHNHRDITYFGKRHTEMLQTP